MPKYTFTAGIRQVTVKAKDLQEAALKAREELDRRCAKQNIEPPVAWTLQLLRVAPESQGVQ